MVTKIENGLVLHDGCFEKLPLYISGGRILAVGGELPADRRIDAGGGYVVPGFIDLHCHGGAGFDFSDGDAAGAVKAAEFHLRHGTTTLYPTLLSADIQALERAVCAVEQARQSCAAMEGIHLEGPYFSPNQTGAQNGRTLRSPQPEEYGALLENHAIARWDYAPELDGEDEFLKALLQKGVLPAAGHTDATCRRMEAAAAAGCRLITHLYSCTSTIRREQGFRVAGVVEAAYLCDDIYAELIADGCHLPAELLRLAYKCKGPDRLVLVTDAMRAAGMGEGGEFDLGGVACMVEDGVAKLPDRSAFAGSVATADRLVRTCVAAGISLEDSIKMITQTPAAVMGLTDRGALEPGCLADLVILSPALEVRTVIKEGCVVQ